MTEVRDYIPRTLSWTDAALKIQKVRDTEIVERFSGPTIILGDPGIGKTWLMEMLGEQDGLQFFRATSLLRQPDQRDFGGQRLVIDGLDEVASIKEGDPLHNVLTKLIACGKPPFILSCRSAEWKEVTGKLDIADEYGVAPVCLDLELLSEDEAVAALERRMDQTKARKAIYALKQADLEEFFQNPLYLDFVAAIVKADGELPETRAGLYEQAVAQLRTESNARHKGKGIDALSEEAALDAAGAIMASILITDASGIAMNGDGATGLKLAELSELADSGAMTAVMRSNLFRSISGAPGQFAPMHRTVAEFLGARWLARHIDRHPRSRHLAGRIIGMMTAEGGVPSSLRGLHAWLPKFSPMRLGPGAIDRDPYGIIRYGDGDGLSSAQARDLIAALRRLSKFEPWFRGGYWATEAKGGLAQRALLEDIRTIIMDDSETVAFRSLFTEAVAGSDLVSDLAAELTAILFDTKRAYCERHDAAMALAKTTPQGFDWPDALKLLLKSKNRDCHRLAVELIDDIGFERIPDHLIAQVILAHAQLFLEKKRETRTFGSFFRLEREFPYQRIAAVLDALAAMVLPKLDPKKWWGEGYDERWSEFAGLVRKLCSRLLAFDASSVSPEQLRNWLGMIEREYMRNNEEVQAIANHLQSDDRLRRGVQRLALLHKHTEKGFFARSNYLSRISSGFGVTDDDARLLLAELVARNNQADRESWMALVAHFRTDGVIPADIRKLARPYAKGDSELLDFLIKKPKRGKREEWEIKDRKNRHEREIRKAKNTAKARKNYTNNIDAIRAGEFRWIFAPSQAYLGMYSDLERKAPPEGRVEEWLGEEICAAALEGFEAVLHRNDLPTAEQIAQSYADSRVWNFIYPMLAGAGRRHLAGKGFDDLPAELVSALLLGCEQELLSGREQFDGLEDALREHLLRDPAAYEAHWRRKMDPMLAHKHSHVQGLYRFARTDRERPLSTRLSLEWLKRRGDLPLEIERELANCLIGAPSDLQAQRLDGLIAIAKARLAGMPRDSDRYRYWRGLQFGLDFNEAVKGLGDPSTLDRNWLWHLTQTFYNRFGDRDGRISASLAQLEWLVRVFRLLWPYVGRPNGVTSGDENPWDATQLIEWAIFQIAKHPSNEATEMLRKLRDAPEDGYTGTIQAAIATHRRARLEANFKSPPLATYKAILCDSGQPQNAADVQAIVLGELAFLQERLRGDPLNLVNNFYDDNSTPRDENACRDQLLIALGPALPFNIQTPPEVAMPQRNRSDGAFVFGGIAVPLECKGQWHKDVWTAAATQLDRFYSIEHKAASKGIYVVFWFGADAPAGRRLKPPPNNAPKPASANDMQLALHSLLPIERRADIAIVVLDLTRP
jgi:hypothetical protein